MKLRNQMNYTISSLVEQLNIKSIGIINIVKVQGQKTDKTKYNKVEMAMGILEKMLKTGRK